VEGGYQITLTDANGTSTFVVPDGAKGEKGDPFRIAKTYKSVALMNAGFATDGVPEGGFVLIATGSVEDADNAKLFVKGETAYEYLIDLSGATGIQGEDGSSIKSIVKTGTSGLVDTYTVTLTDGSTSTFTVTNGKDGATDTPIRYGEGKDSAVSGTSRAIGTESVSIGSGNLAGSKAFTIVGLDEATNTYTLDSVKELKVGDVYSLRLACYNKTTGELYAPQTYNVGAITAINAVTNTVTVNTMFKPSDVGTGFAFQPIAASDLVDENGIDLEVNAFRIIKKPWAGTRTIGDSAIALGSSNEALSKNAFASGCGTTAYGSYSHTEGFGTSAGYAAHSEGINTRADGAGAHTEGINTYAKYAGHAEGKGTSAPGNHGHAEGSGTQALGTSSHAEGLDTIAKADQTHTEGYHTIAIGDKSHAEGNSTEARGPNSHAGGLGTIAAGDSQTAIGAYNAIDEDAYLLVGNGTGTSEKERSNAFGVRKDGTAYVGAHPKNPMDVSTKQFVNETLKNGLAASDLTVAYAKRLSESSATSVNSTTYNMPSGTGGYFVIFKTHNDSPTLAFVYFTGSTSRDDMGMVTGYGEEAYQPQISYNSSSKKFVLSVVRLDGTAQNMTILKVARFI
jgi:hypothetical protein